MFGTCFDVKDKLLEMKKVPTDKQERSLQHERLKCYFLICFAQSPGALDDFVTHVLGYEDDVIHFECMQKTNKEDVSVLVGIELSAKENYGYLLQQMRDYNINFTEINKDDTLYGFLV